MRTKEFEEQLEQLRLGKLELAAAAGDGLTNYAGSSLYELRAYLGALEDGYRSQAWEIRRLLLKLQVRDAGMKTRTLRVRVKSGEVREYQASSYALAVLDDADTLLVIRGAEVIDALSFVAITEVFWCGDGGQIARATEGVGTGLAFASPSPTGAGDEGRTGDADGHAADAPRTPEQSEGVPSGNDGIGSAAEGWPIRGSATTSASEDCEKGTMRVC